LRRHPVLAYFLLALGFSWAGWIPFALARAGRFPTTVPAEVAWLAEFGPTIAALLLTGLESGWTGVGRLLRRCGKAG